MMGWRHRVGKIRGEWRGGAVSASLIWSISQSFLGFQQEYTSSVHPVSQPGLANSNQALGPSALGPYQGTEGWQVGCHAFCLPLHQPQCPVTFLHHSSVTLLAAGLPSGSAPLTQLLHPAPLPSHVRSALSAQCLCQTPRQAISPQCSLQFRTSCPGDLEASSLHSRSQGELAALRTLVRTISSLKCIPTPTLPPHRSGNRTLVRTQDFQRFSTKTNSEALGTLGVSGVGAG